MRKRILFVYSRAFEGFPNRRIHTGWVDDCRQLYDVRYWGYGYGPTTLLHLKKTIDQYKPDYLYLTITRRYLNPDYLRRHGVTDVTQTWLPDLTSIRVPKIFVEVDTYRYPPQIDWYKQFSKVYIRNHFGRPEWKQYPIFRWSVSENMIKRAITARRGFYFIGNLNSKVYCRRTSLKRRLRGLVGFKWTSKKYRETLWSANALLCPTESNYGNFIPAKVLEYFASGAAVVTNCDLRSYGLPDIAERVLAYAKGYQELQQIFKDDGAWRTYQDRHLGVIPAHTHTVRYRELFV